MKTPDGQLWTTLYFTSEDSPHRRKAGFVIAVSYLRSWSLICASIAFSAYALDSSSVRENRAYARFSRTELMCIASLPFGGCPSRRHIVAAGTACSRGFLGLATGSNALAPTIRNKCIRNPHGHPPIAREKRLRLSKACR